ncbi:unnamed protein product [Dimorphilus gyrociliatus]|uniref:Uncharacterized protein n=1 Tax=Dimorphilus gyrociliatus TaxID=2664684 RepID=A0A7I8VHM3_9ANNE|nr:unnamed protein product [Dimorphilus gyrociliatus]
MSDENGEDQEKKSEPDDLSIYDLSLYESDNALADNEFFRKFHRGELQILKEINCWMEKYDVKKSNDNEIDEFLEDSYSIIDLSELNDEEKSLLQDEKRQVEEMTLQEILGRLAKDLD